MALVVYDRVQETTATTGTGTITLGGAVAGYQTFAVVGNGNTTFYCIVNGSAWEVGIGTYTSSGTTLARTTVLSNSNGNTSPITLVGASNVFVTYPAGKSVNLDSSGNVGPLGTISSGVWNGTTIGVAYGGTGVTTSSGTNSVVLRDANANITFNNFTSGFTAVTAAAGTTVLTVASTRTQVLVGSTTQTIQLPNATTLQIGQSFIFVNNSSGALTITNNAGATIDVVPAGGATQLGATSIATNAGTWGIYSFLPGTYNFSIPFADFGNATISNAVWNGTTITPAYGGTGLTTFTAANNALYSTGATTLTAGTLPVAAGGTGATTLTSNGVVYGNGTSAAGITAAGTTGQVLVATTSGAPSWGAVPTTAAVTSLNFSTTGLTPATATTGAITVAGTLVAANGGTGQSSYAVGDLLYASTTTALSKLADVATGNALISGGVGVAPSYGKIGLTTHVSGTLPIANGGTNATATPTAGAIAYGTSTAYAFTAAGTSGQVLTSAGAGVPTWTTATNANTASTIVQRDASGNFSAGTITAALSGNATTASNATQAGGFTPSQTSGVANRIVVADASGYINNSYFNSTDNAITSGVSAIMSKAGDNYYRSASAAAVATFISGQTMNIAGSSTSCSGNAANVTGTVAIANGGTGQTTAAAAFNALNPMTTTGDILYEASPTTAARLGIGSTGQVLTVSGGLPAWSAAPSSNITTLGLYENSATIAANYTIGTGNNAMSAGPITINTGITVTVPTGSTWTVV
jgi:hypothetical protein